MPSAKVGQPAQVARDFHGCRAASDHGNMRRAATCAEGYDDPLRFLQTLDGFDRENRGCVAVNVLERDKTARVAGQHIVFQGQARGRGDGSASRIDARHLVPDKGPALAFNHMPGGKADVVSGVGQSEHARAHARVVVVVRGLDNGDLMPVADQVPDVGQDHHVRVATPARISRCPMTGSRADVMQKNKL